jgi:hypothetical protein
VRYGFNPGRCVCRMHSVQKVRALPWKEFHAAPMLSYRNLGDVERSASTRHDRFVLDSLSRCNIQWAKWLAFQSKTSPVRQSGSGGAGLGYGLGHVWVTFATGCY